MSLKPLRVATIRGGEVGECISLAYTQPISDLRAFLVWTAPKSNPQTATPTTHTIKILLFENKPALPITKLASLSFTAPVDVTNGT